MTIQEATREWFEMEGWEFGQFTLLSKGTHGAYCRYSIKDNDGMGRNTLPTIDANYFFDKVVGRMRELKLHPNIYRHNTKYVWIFNWYRFGGNKIFTEHNEGIVLAGLQAAIAARKEIENGKSS